MSRFSHMESFWANASGHLFVVSVSAHLSLGYCILASYDVSSCPGAYVISDSQKYHLPVYFRLEFSLIHL